MHSLFQKKVFKIIKIHQYKLAKNNKQIQAQMKKYLKQIRKIQLMML
jgi:hypothetical protein